MSPWKLILSGVVRWVLTILGTWLVAKGLIDEDTKQALLSEGVSDVVGYVLMFLALVWSAFEKQKFVEWLRRALHLDPKPEVIAAKQISNMVTK